MGFIYSHDNIPEAIVKALLENKKAKKLEPNRFHQADIKRRIEQILGHDITDRQLRKNLVDMKDQELLNRYDMKEGTRGYKVYYSLTDKAETMYTLKILGSDEIVERRKNLYQLLIFFRAFKRSSSITERQLHTFLRRMGMTNDSLEIAKNSRTSLSASSGMIKDITHFRPLKGVQITKWDQGVSNKEPKGAIYHVTLPGFSVEEFASHLNKLRKGKEPQPNLGITDVPSVLSKKYSEPEIVDAVESFRSNGIIKPINEVFPGEMRYDLADESLVKFIKDVWLVHEYDLMLLFERLVYGGRPKEEDINYLILMYGKEIADRILANAYHTRKERKNRKNQEEEKIAKKFIRSFEIHRRSFIDYIKKRHKNVIDSYEILSQLIEGISFSHFVSKPV